MKFIKSFPLWLLLTIGCSALYIAAIFNSWSGWIAIPANIGYLVCWILMQESFTNLIDRIEKLEKELNKNAN